MSLNTAVMFGKASDEWTTPQYFYDALDVEFHFVVDVAASSETRKCGFYCGPDHAWGDNWRNYLTFDLPALMQDTKDAAAWMNPPYSQCRGFISKAAQDARHGCTVVCLVPSRTDTRWWHSDVWDASTHAYRPGVEVRFVKGRLKFGNSVNSAPFPSVVIVFRPT